MKLEIGKDYKTHGGWKATPVLIEDGYVWCVHHSAIAPDDGKNLKKHFTYGDVYTHARAGSQGKFTYDIISEWVEPAKPIKLEFASTWSQDVFESGLIYPVNQTEKLEKFIGKRTKITVEELE